MQTTAFNRVPLSPGLCLVIAASLMGGAAAGQGSLYGPRMDYDLSQPSPKQMARADFDRDGNLDIIVTCEGQNSGRVSVLYGDGASDFGTEVDLTAYLAWGLCVDDFDGDGWPDFAVTSSGWAQHGIGIVHNNHNRTFSNASQVSSLGSPPVALASGDFDQDGVVDLAVASTGGGYSVDWFQGYGNGSFSAFHVVPYTLGLVGARLVAADLDGDGLTDLALAHQGGVKILRNTGTTYDRFHPPIIGVQSTAQTIDLAVGDFDRDGVLDLVTAEAFSRFRVWRGVGGGDFAYIGAYPASGGINDLELADLDGDGSLDVMLTNWAGIELFYQRGPGVFVGPVRVTSGLQPVAGIAGDWNNDGRLDLATACNNAAQDAYVSIHEHVPAPLGGTFPWGAGLGSGSTPTRHVRR
ncbi:MAG: VCBS repeat-containing protein [Planctomycetota bacterium]